MQQEERLRDIEERLNDVGWGLGERLQDMERGHVTSVHKFTDICLFFSMKCAFGKIRKYVG